MSSREIEMLINKQISKLEIEGFSPTPPPRVDGSARWSAARRRAVLQPAGAMPATPMRPAAGPNLGGKFPLCAAGGGSFSMWMTHVASNPRRSL